MVKRLCLAWKRNKQNKDKGAELTVACSLFAQKTPESKQKENIMKSKMFEKETFKKEVVENVKYLYRKTMDEASEQEIFQAVSYVVKDVIIDQWLATQQEFDKADPKIVYYMSMEFLMGRALGNNLINLTVYNEVKEALEEMGINLNAIEDQEPDPALGNGGLGRLAACFMESLATLGYPAYGCGIRYHYGMFRQKIENGYQVEEPDNWLQNGYPFELKRPEYNFEVKFGGYVRAEAQPDGRTRFVQEGYQSVKAIPYDMPIVGYNNNVVNTLMIWDAEPMECFELDSFDKGDYHRAIEQQNLAKNLVEVLYPNDNHIAGKELRLKQQYFFVSASLQRAIARFKKNHPDIHMLPEKAVFQMNDTHPTVAVAELMRILLDEEGLEWDDAWNITTKCCAYTNHTIMAEALEKWPIEIFSRLLPRIYQIVEEINRRFVLEIQQKYPGDNHKVEKMAIVYDGQVKMAHLAICAGYSVNGVARLHTEILKETELNNFYKIYPEKFNNKTNGITFRRWLLHCNPALTELLDELIGEGYKKDAAELEKLLAFKDDEKVLDRLVEIKHANKEALCKYLEETQGVKVSPDTIFDIQIKRLHEYKRQQLNALYIIDKYLEIKAGKIPAAPVTAIFGAKAAPAYVIAKDIIHLILCLQELIEKDPEVRPYFRVLMIENYNVSKAAKVIPAANISEQISLASKEASGTGNMKFMLNGALTLGTEDGANVEIRDLVGEENIYIFGRKPQDVIDLYEAGTYSSKEIYEEDALIHKLVDFITGEELLAIGDEESLTRLHRELIGKDWFMTLLDTKEYITTKEKVYADYEDRKTWNKKALINIAKAGFFSSDRTIAQYNENIWKLK